MVFRYGTASGLYGFRPVLPEDLYELRWAADPRLSPDGGTAAVTETWIDRETGEYRGAIWLVPVDGSSPPRRLTSGKKVDERPSWSPDGTRLAFVSTRDRPSTAFVSLASSLGFRSDASARPPRP